MVQSSEPEWRRPGEQVLDDFKRGGMVKAQDHDVDIDKGGISRGIKQLAGDAFVSRAGEGFNKMYGIVHPSEQWESNRGVRLSPFYERERALDAVFYEAVGWERPHWYASNAPLLEEYGDRINRREAGGEWRGCPGRPRRADLVYDGGTGRGGLPGRQQTRGEVRPHGRRHTGELRR